MQLTDKIFKGLYRRGQCQKKEDRHQNRCGNNAFFHFSMSLRTGDCADDIPR